ncbi:5739_t:CDS:1, partial [Gigaspora margarita]
SLLKKNRQKEVVFSLLCLNTKKSVFGDNCEHIVMMGDFSASGPYLSKTKQDELDKNMPVFEK